MGDVIFSAHHRSKRSAYRFPPDDTPKPSARSQSKTPTTRRSNTAQARWGRPFECLQTCRKQGSSNPHAVSSLRTLRTLRILRHLDVVPADAPTIEPQLLRTKRLIIRRSWCLSHTSLTYTSDAEALRRYSPQKAIAARGLGSF